MCKYDVVINIGDDECFLSELIAEIEEKHKEIKWIKTSLCTRIKNGKGQLIYEGDRLLSSLGYGEKKYKKYFKVEYHNGSLKIKKLFEVDNYNTCIVVDDINLSNRDIIDNVIIDNITNEDEDKLKEKIETSNNYNYNYNYRNELIYIYINDNDKIEQYTVKDFIINYYEVVEDIKFRLTTEIRFRNGEKRAFTEGDIISYITQKECIKYSVIYEKGSFFIRDIDKGNAKVLSNIDIDRYNEI